MVWVFHRIQRIRCQRLQDGTPLPHAPGVRMTAVTPNSLKWSNWGCLEFSNFEVLKFQLFEFLKSRIFYFWNFEKFEFRKLVLTNDKNPVNISSKTWIWISYLSKTWSGILVTLLFSGKGSPKLFLFARKAPYIFYFQRTESSNIK